MCAYLGKGVRTAEAGGGGRGRFDYTMSLYREAAAVLRGGQGGGEVVARIETTRLKGVE